MVDKDKLSYWERRALELEQSNHDDGDKVIAKLAKSYMIAQEYLTGEVEKIYKRYLSKSGLSESEVDKILNTAITSDQLVELKAMVKKTENKELKKQLQIYLSGLAAKERISRLELLKAKAYLVAKQLADVQLTETTKYYTKTIEDAYKHTAASSIIGQTQKDFNVYQNGTVPEVSKVKKTIKFTEPESGKVLHEVDVMPDKPTTKLTELTTETVKQQLAAPWEGKNYSQRIWKNTDELADRLQELFTAKELSGMPEREMRLRLQKEFGVSAYQARRLVRTESAYMANQARLQAWNDHHVEEYSLVAVLDFRTSEFCRDHDGRVYKVADAKCNGFYGNFPPFHPFCRTVPVAYYGTSKNGGYRTARDPKTKETMKIPRDATYREWEQMIIKGDHK